MLSFWCPIKPTTFFGGGPNRRRIALEQSSGEPKGLRLPVSEMQGDIGGTGLAHFAHEESRLLMDLGWQDHCLPVYCPESFPSSPSLEVHDKKMPPAPPPPPPRKKETTSYPEPPQSQRPKTQVDSSTQTAKPPRQVAKSRSREAVKVLDDQGRGRLWQLLQALDWLLVNAERRGFGSFESASGDWFVALGLCSAFFSRASIFGRLDVPLRLVEGIVGLFPQQVGSFAIDVVLLRGDGWSLQLQKGMAGSFNYKRVPPKRDMSKLNIKRIDPKRAICMGKVPYLWIPHFECDLLQAGVCFFVFSFADLSFNPSLRLSMWGCLF